MKEYINYNNTYLIPDELEKEVQNLFDKIPGWMGMYVKEFDEVYEQYRVTKENLNNG